MILSHKIRNEKLFADPKTGTQLMASLKEEALISLAGLSSDLSCFAGMEDPLVKCFLGGKKCRDIRCTQVAVTWTFII